MAMDFPNTPTIGQVYTQGNRSWSWDGVAWVGVTNAPYPLFGLEAAKPVNPAGAPIMRYWATDTKRDWLWDGTGWIIMREPAQSFTCTPRQNSINLTYTVGTPFVFHRSNGWCETLAKLVITGAGTNATPFDCTTAGLPACITQGGFANGPFAYYDASFGSYQGTCGVNDAATQVSFTPHNSNWTLGANPAFPAANGDVFGFQMRYRMSSLYT